MTEAKLVAEIRQLTRERDEARDKARKFWGTIKVYIQNQRGFTERQNEERIANIRKGFEWLEPAPEETQ